MNKKIPQETREETADKKTPYKVTLKFNGEEFSVTRDSLDEAIRAIDPVSLHTEVYVEVEHGDMRIERKLSLVQGKRLFVSDEHLEVFISNLNLEIYG